MAALTRRGALAAAAGLLAGAAVRLPPAAQPISRLDLPWWRDRHAAKLAEARRGTARLVLLGDSITQDYEMTGPEPFRDFRAVWTRFYAGREALNLGFSGDATSHLLWRMRNGEIDGIAPRAAIILIGANNLGRLHWSAADTVLGIETVVAEARKRLPRAGIVLLGVLPSDRGEWVRSTTGEINRALAERFGNGRVPQVHWHDAGHVLMRDGAIDTGLFYDPRLTPPAAALHPSPEGQARIAAVIEPTVARLLDEAPRA